MKITMKVLHEERLPRFVILPMKSKHLTWFKFTLFALQGCLPVPFHYRLVLVQSKHDFFVELNYSCGVKSFHRTLCNHVKN